MTRKRLWDRRLFVLIGILMLKNDVAQWVDRWQKVGPILEQLEKETLQSPDYHERLKELLPMFHWVCAHAEPRIYRSQ